MQDDTDESEETEIKALRRRLAALDAERRDLLGRLHVLESPQKRQQAKAPEKTSGPFSAQEKIHMARQLFRGRDDVFPQRWTNRKTGRSGYSPACSHEWVRGLCDKPRIKCTDCPNQAFIPVSDAVIRHHLTGQPLNGRDNSNDFTIGVYHLLPDERCWFLAADFDKATWQEDIAAFLRTCQDKAVPAYLERSRSGKGGHAWIFFSSPVAALDARKWDHTS